MLTYKILQITGFAVGGLITALICNILLLRFAHSLGIRNKNDIVIRWSNESKPSLGGVSFFVVFGFASICFSILFDDVNIFQNKQFVGLFTGGVLAFVMGLADDAYNTRPFLKLFIQILCGVLMIFTDTTIHLFHEPFVDAIFTILWVVLIMNSLNMLDNMDGITGTTVLFILSSCLFAGWLVFEFNTNIWTLLNVALIGGVIGFLTMNIHPSKLFMGDAGSQFIGFFVAYFLAFYINSVTWQIALFLLCTIPFWTSNVIRMISWIPLLGRNGLVNDFLLSLGIIDAPQEWLLYSGFSIVLAFVHLYTLFMIVPIFNSMMRIDKSIIEAAYDNGANGLQILWNVIIPLCKPGIVIGSIFVITVVMGDFITIGIMGGQQIPSIGKIIYVEMSYLQLPAAAANAVILLSLTLLIIWVMTKMIDIRKEL